MLKTLPLDKGEIIIGDNKIVINDDEKKTKLVLVLKSCMWIAFGVISVLRFTKTGDEFLLWTGLLIGVGHLITLVFALLRSPKSEIELHEIVSAVFNNRKKNKFLDLNLKSKFKRRISKIDPISDELKSFFTEKEWHHSTLVTYSPY